MTLVIRSRRTSTPTIRLVGTNENQFYQNGDNEYNNGKIVLEFLVDKDTDDQNVEYYLPSVRGLICRIEPEWGCV